MAKLIEIPLKKLFLNLDETALTASLAALENCYLTEADGISRLPGLLEFSDLEDESDVYLSQHKNDMIAVAGNGKTYRLDKNGNVEKIEGPQVLGGRRVMFTNDESNLYMAAGREIIAFDGAKNKVLSKDAPLASHIGILNSRMVANEITTDRWSYSDAADLKTWPADSVFAATSRPSPVNALVVNDFNEILVTKKNSIEQYATYSSTSTSTPFLYRWTIGDGISEPYTLMFNDNAVWGLNSKHEYIKIRGQSTQVVSSDIARMLQEKYEGPQEESFNDAWSFPLNIDGQNFNILQLPRAENGYGTKGVTLLYDIRKKKWSELFGFDEEIGIPACWPGSSILELWGRIYVGGKNGKIYQFDKSNFTNDGLMSRFFARTCHFTEFGPSRINRLVITLKRGVGSYTEEPNLFYRVNRDNRGFKKWQRIPLGLAGHKMLVARTGSQGSADSWQFEFMTTDNCEIEIRKIQAEVDRIRH